MRPIDADALLEKLGMARDCENCKSRAQEPSKFIPCGLTREMQHVCNKIASAPTLIPKKQGADGKGLQGGR